MRIMFGLLLVFVALVAMIFAFAWIDGEFGESSGGVRINQDGEMTGVEKNYLEYVVAYLDMSAIDISNLGVLYSNPEFENNDWEAAVYVSLNRIQSAFANVAGLIPTERLVPFHESAVETLSHSAKFAELAEKAFEVGSTELSSEAIDELIAAGNGFAETERLLNEFLETHPVPERLIPPEGDATGAALAPSSGS